VQSKASSVSAVKKKCKENVSPLIIPEVADEEELASDNQIAVVNDVASVHQTGVHCAVDVTSNTPEVLANRDILVRLLASFVTVSTQSMSTT